MISPGLTFSLSTTITRARDDRPYQVFAGQSVGSRNSLIKHFRLDWSKHALLIGKPQSPGIHGQEIRRRANWPPSLLIRCGN